MNAFDLIAKKKAACALEEAELRFLVDGFLEGAVSEAQMAAFLMATLFRGMTPGETASLTRIMMASGRTFDFSALPAPAVDKHSTGGVGDTTSIPLVPVAVECGLLVPMISGRALGATGGTLDKLESIPGMRTDLSPARFEAQVAELGACFGAQTVDVVPADRMLYALRDATATIDSIPLIVSSILSKKLAEGLRGVVIDVKCGRGAFMRTPSDARALASALEVVGRAMGVSVKTVVTAMDDPLGLAVGNALEVEEAIHVLEGRGPADTTALTLRLVAEMLVLGGLVSDIGEGEARARGAIESGRALVRFERIVAAQGGRIDVHSRGCGLPRARVMRTLAARAGGFVSRIDALVVGETVRGMGGGRFAQGDLVDPSVGVRLRAKRGDEIAAGGPLIDIHAADEESALQAARKLEGAIGISREREAPAPLFLMDD